MRRWLEAEFIDKRDPKVTLTAGDQTSFCAAVKAAWTQRNVPDTTIRLLKKYAKGTDVPRSVDKKIELLWDAVLNA